MNWNEPNAKQKAWREEVRGLGCIVTHCGPPEIHHPAGRTSMHRKIAIGHAWVLPLRHDVHVLVTKQDPWNVKALWLSYNFERDAEQIESMTLHEFEKYLFAEVCKRVSFPFGDDVYEAIMDWHR